MALVEFFQKLNKITYKLKGHQGQYISGVHYNIPEDHALAEGTSTPRHQQYEPFKTLTTPHTH